MIFDIKGKRAMVRNILFGIFMMFSLANAGFIRDNVNDIVLDTSTTLMWQDNADANTTKYNWGESINYCENLTLGGYDDWHLPNMNELRSIADKNRYNPSASPVFKYMQSNWYWSSDTSDIDDRGWNIVFNDGQEALNTKEYTYGGADWGCYRRCVRGDITPPVFTSDSVSSVDENETDAITLIATDDSGSVTYSISGTDADSFDVDSVSGEVTFKSYPDYDTKNSYTFTAKATDPSGHFVTQEIMIAVLDGEYTIYRAYIRDELPTTYVRYTRDDTEDTVVDDMTNLMWQDDSEAATIMKNWSDAPDYCETLTLGGYSDWRMPDADELYSIVDITRSPAIDSKFNNISSIGRIYYWSSTFDCPNPFAPCPSNIALSVSFDFGNVEDSYETDVYNIRCVRDNN